MIDGLMSLYLVLNKLLIIVGNDNMAYEGRTPNGIPNPFKPLIEYIDEKSAFCSQLLLENFCKF